MFLIKIYETKRNVLIFVVYRFKKYTQLIWMKVSLIVLRNIEKLSRIVYTTFENILNILYRLYLILLGELSTPVK